MWKVGLEKWQGPVTWQKGELRSVDNNIECAGFIHNKFASKKTDQAQPSLNWLFD